MAETNPYTNPPEEAEHMALVQWLELHAIRYTHVPNEGKHKVQYRAKQKRLGVKPGVPDILIFDRPPLYPENVGVAIELKRQKGGQIRPEQKEWLENLKNRGWVAAVCKGADDAIKLLQQLGFGKGECKG